VRIALAANPNAGGDASPDEVADRLRRAGADVVEAEGDADRLAVAGGDGSIGLAAAVAGDRDIPLAVIPAGTANDFARALDVPADIDAACRLAASESPGTAWIDLGWMTHGDDESSARPFVNAASAGLSPAAAKRAASLKRFLGPVAYPVGALLGGFSDRPIRCRLACDGDEVFAGEAWQLAVFGTGAFGGGSTAEFTEDGDGCLDVAAVPAGSRFFLPRLAWAMRTGHLGDVPGVHRSRGREIEVAVPAGTAFNVDGELIESGRAIFRAAANRVRVLVPG
jgi:diacylglycerol kinase family enzyme